VGTCKGKKSKHTGTSPDNNITKLYGILTCSIVLMFTSEEESERVGVSSLDDEIVCTYL